MDYSIREIDDRNLKREIANGVLRALPDWFGIEEAIVEYAQKSQNMRFWAACVTGRPVGFLSLQRHNVYTFEIYCMGVRPQYHRHGLGAALIAVCEEWCRANAAEFLTVKTLDASQPDESYAKTRQFYVTMGFRPLEVFPTLWGPANPCLLMAKSLTQASSSTPLP